jgi:hypothetical protein
MRNITNKMIGQALSAATTLTLSGLSAPVSKL